ncbi:hypothetical protein Tco_0183885 [Tanacetum coccineum]
MKNKKQEKNVEHGIRALWQLLMEIEKLGFLSDKDSTGGGDFQEKRKRYKGTRRRRAKGKDVEESVFSPIPSPT